MNCTHARKHSHFTAIWTLSEDNPGEPVPSSGIFWCKMKITQADAPTIRMDCHLIQTNWCPNLCHFTIFMPDALPGTTLPIYPGLGQAPNMLACIPGGMLVYIYLFLIPLKGLLHPLFASMDKYQCFCIIILMSVTQCTDPDDIEPVSIDHWPTVACQIWPT